MAKQSILVGNRRWQKIPRRKEMNKMPVLHKGRWSYKPEFLNHIFLLPYYLVKYRVLYSILALGTLGTI